MVSLVLVLFSRSARSDRGVHKGIDVGLELRKCNSPVVIKELEIVTVDQHLEEHRPRGGLGADQQHRQEDGNVRSGQGEGGGQFLRCVRKDLCVNHVFKVEDGEASLSWRPSKDNWSRRRRRRRRRRSAAINR
jgi:hypothetical protein